MKSLDHIPSATGTPSGRWRNRSHRLYRDRTDRVHFGMNADAPDRSLWLAQCRQWLLGGKSIASSEPTFLLLSLVAFDAIATAADLNAAWLAIPNIYRDGEAACIEWSAADGRQDRRVLSSVTVLSWSVQGDRQVPLALVSQTLMSRLQSGSDAERRNRLERPCSFDQLLDWVRHALMTELPGDLFAHVCGAAPLTALPRSALARRRRRLALKATITTGELPDTGEGSMLLMDALGQRASAGGIQVIERMQDACRVDQNEANAAAQRRRMLRDLQALVPPAVLAGHWTSLLLLWVIHLVRFGTRRKCPLSPNTIDPYIQLALERLWKRLRDTAPDNRVNWEAVYLDLLSDPKIERSQLNKVAAALTAFHEFIETVLDVPPLARSLDVDIPVRAARANVVWPHEWHWILDQLPAEGPDDRLASQLAAVVALLAGACLRIQDVWHVHVFGVAVDDETILVAIDPLPSAGHGKSASARRQVEIRESRCRDVLVRWHERRELEGALPRDLLFGDLGEPRRPWRAGATEFLLNRWLKAATGDVDIGSHALRHTFATLARDDMGDGDQRRLDQLSAQAGHAATQTTLTHYVHLYEAALRQQLDRTIRSLRITETQACQLSGTRPGWIRKRWERCPGEPAGVVWSALEERAAEIDMADVCTGFEFEVPCGPDMTQRAAWSFALVLRCLSDLAQGCSADQVQLRQGISSEQRIAVEAAVRSWRATSTANLQRRAVVLNADQLPWREGFCRTPQKKWRPLMQALMRSEDCDAIRPACTAWLQVLRGNYLSLTDTATAAPLLEWLSAAGIESRQLVVSHVNGVDLDLREACDVIKAIFDGPPELRTEQARRGRPPLYLMLRNKGCLSTPPSNAALSVAGLHALLFSAWVWCQLPGDTR